MFTCESLTQVFLFLLRTFVRDAASVLRLRYLGYDRACDLKPFLVNQAKKSSAGAILLLDRVKFLVDKFHCEKHTGPTCMPPDNPKCITLPYHNFKKYMALVCFSQSYLVIVVTSNVARSFTATETDFSSRGINSYF